MAPEKEDPGDIGKSKLGRRDGEFFFLNQVVGFFFCWGFWLVFFYCFVCLFGGGRETTRSLCTLGKHSTTELYTQSKRISFILNICEEDIQMENSDE
jgi:hypothetical protein